MPNLEIRFERAELSEPTRNAVDDAFEAGPSVLATWNVKLWRSDGSSSDNIDRKRLSREDLIGSALRLGIRATAMNLDEVRRVEVRFKLELGRSTLGTPIQRYVGAPFAGRTEASPSSRGGTPAYHLHWSARNTADRRIVRRTGDSRVDPDQPAAVRARWGAVRNELATIHAGTHPCFNEAPALTDSLVIDVQEFTPPVDDFRNWSHPGWLPEGVFHQERRVTQCRAKRDIDAIVLHETASWGRIDRGWPSAESWRNGFANWPDHPPHPPLAAPLAPGQKAPKANRKFTPCADVHGGAPHRAQVGAHFCVHTDGSIAQHYDAVQRLGHGPPHNDHSVGIEFTNVTWAHNADVDAANTIELPDALLAPNGTRWDTVTSWGQKDRYVVPPREVLESHYKLLDDLIFHFAIPEIWRPVATPEGANLFLMNRWEAELGKIQPGIYAHFNFGSHTDGTFPTLYTWLRRQRGFCSYHAREQAMQMCDEHPHGRWVLRPGNRKFLDVDGVSHAASEVCSSDDV